MPETRQCPKCNGAMTQGRILRLNEYVARNQSMYVFAPDDDAAPNLAKMLSGGSGGKRKPLVAFCCENCGFTEFYGLPSS